MKESFSNYLVYFSHVHFWEPQFWHKHVTQYGWDKIHSKQQKEIKQLVCLKGFEVVFSMITHQHKV